MDKNFSVSNLNEKQDYRAKLPREGFDIGNTYQFTSAPGMILPVYKHILNQGEKIFFRPNVKTLANPMLRPADLNCRECIDVFFVPLQLIYTAFGNHFYQGNDLLTSLLGSKKPEISETLPLLGLHYGFTSPALAEPSFLFSPFVGNPSTDIGSTESTSQPNYLGFDCMGKGMYRLLMHLDYNPNVVFSKLYDYDPSQESPEFDYQGLSQMSIYQPSVFPAFLAAYQAIYQNYYRDDDREERDLYSYQVDYLAGTDPTSEFPRNAKSLLMLRYHQRKKDYFTGMRVSPIASSLNTLVVSGDDIDGSGNLNSLSILSAVNNFLNLDDNFGYQADGTTVTDDESDIFTQYASSSSTITTAGLRSLFAVEKYNRIAGRVKRDYDSQTLAHLGFKVPHDVKHQISFIKRFEGGLGSSVVQSTSDTDNGVTGAALGELAANVGGGISSKSGCSFVAPCHGIFMAVHYLVPDSSYPQGICLDKINNLTDRLSFYQPEFDKLGSQPVYAYEAFNENIVMENYVQSIRFLTSPIGWQYRYQQYKQKYNRHSIAFLNPILRYSSDFFPENTWSPWVLGKRPFDSYLIDADTYSIHLWSPFTFMVSPDFFDDLFEQKYNPGIGEYGIYASNRAHKVYWEQVSWHDILHPSDVDTSETFITSYELNTVSRYMVFPWLMFQTDPFKHSCRFDVKLVSTMSRFGEPELD